MSKDSKAARQAPSVVQRWDFLFHNRRALKARLRADQRALSKRPKPPTNLDELGAQDRWERWNAPRFVNCIP